MSRPLPADEDGQVSLSGSEDENNSDDGGLVSDTELGNANNFNNPLDDAVPGITDNIDENEARPVEPKKKRLIKNPRPKLNLERLKGPRGLLALLDLFKDFKFKGRGYEKEDLAGIMKRYQHWAHRLFPQYKFDDCLEQLENLGRKKEVQALLQKIRLGLHTVENNGDLTDEDENDKPMEMGAVNPPVNVFDSLINDAYSRSENGRSSAVSAPLATLTPEQLQRMEQNRLLAQQKRLARLRAAQEE